jgi:KDO2-lipid IV(A) lauroyltransferase
MGVMAPFFGRDAYTMTLSVRLVQQTGAPVLLAWGERLGWGRGYRVHVQPMPAPLPLDLAQAAAAVNQAMQGLIRQCPGQYLWGYARYKHPQATAHES